MKQSAGGMVTPLLRDHVDHAAANMVTQKRRDHATPFAASSSV
jgi:hypothetical protein